MTSTGQMPKGYVNMITYLSRLVKPKLNSIFILNTPDVKNYEDNIPALEENIVMFMVGFRSELIFQTTELEIIA